jgi:hypothetical protein
MSVNPAFSGGALSNAWGGPERAERFAIVGPAIDRLVGERRPEEAFVPRSARA